MRNETLIYEAPLEIMTECLTERPVLWNTKIILMFQCFVFILMTPLTSASFDGVTILLQTFNLVALYAIINKYYQVVSAIIETITPRTSLISNQI